MQFIISLLTWQNLIHLIDILVIWFLIYELLMLIRGTRAVRSEERRVGKECRL